MNVLNADCLDFNSTFEFSGASPFVRDDIILRSSLSSISTSFSSESENSIQLCQQCHLEFKKIYGITELYNYINIALQN